MENSTLLQQMRQLGLSEEQAIKVLVVAGNYIKEKFPILEANINSYLKEEFKQADPDVVSKVLNN